MSERGEFDYVIVGGGSAGCVLAARLSENPFVRVCLLEAGPADKSVLIHCPAGLALLAKNGAFNWGFETVPQPGLGGRRGYQPRGKVLGGSSSVNAMIYVRGQPEDYDGWASEGNAGWGWHDVLPYFKRAEHNERGGDEFHGHGGPLNVMDLRSPHRFGPIFVEAARQAGHPLNADFNGARQEGVGLYQVTHKNGERFSAAKAYLTPNLGRPNLHVMTGAQTTRVVVVDGRATGVEVRIGCELRAGAPRSAARGRRAAVAAAADALGHRPGRAPALARHRRAPRAARRRRPPARPHRRRRRALAPAPDRLQPRLRARVRDQPGQGVPRYLRRRRAACRSTNFAEAGGFVRSDAGVDAPDLQLVFAPLRRRQVVNHGRRPTSDTALHVRRPPAAAGSRGSVEAGERRSGGGAAHRVRTSRRERRRRSPASGVPTVAPRCGRLVGVRLRARARVLQTRRRRSAR